MYNEHKIIKHLQTANSDELTKHVNSPSRHIREAVARHPNTPIETLTQLANDEEFWVRIEIAANRHTPTHTLTQLATDENPVVRTNVAANPNTNENTLAKLANSELFYIREEIANNPNTPIHILKTLTNDYNDDIREAVEEKRKENLNNYINALEEPNKTHAKLLEPTFTGWSSDLENVLNNIKHGPQKYNTKLEKRAH